MVDDSTGHIFDKNGKYIGLCDTEELKDKVGLNDSQLPNQPGMNRTEVVEHEEKKDSLLNYSGFKDDPI